MQWAIPEIRCTSPKEDMGIPEILTTFFIEESPKISTLLVARVKKTWEFPKYLIIFGTKIGIPNFLLFFDIQNWEFHFKKQFVEFPFF